jgi:hypothetical protein
MSFDQPSSTFTRSEAASRSSAAVNVDSRLDDSGNQISKTNPRARSPLHFSDVRDQIQRLNLQFPPVLTENQSHRAEEDVFREIKHLLGRPLKEVFAEACATWTEILVRAKGGGETPLLPEEETTASSRACSSNRHFWRILGHPQPPWSHQRRPR